MRFSHNKQLGAAAIWFIFLIGAIMSLGALAIEGSRYIGKKARLGDASEAAAIAISANDGVTKVFDKNAAQRDGRSAKDVAELWFRHYITDEKSISLEITRIDEKKEIKQDFITPYKLEYFRYDVQAKTTHDSWFRFSDWARFDDQVVVANRAAAGRIKGGHEPADVVFVADFSGSMNKCVRTGSFKERNCRRNETSKLGHLQNAISEVTSILYNVNEKSSFGFIPFSKRIIIKRKNSIGNIEYSCVSPLQSKPNSDFELIRNNKFFPDLMRLRYSSYGSGNSRKKIYDDLGLTSEQEAIAERYIRWLKGNEGYEEIVSTPYRNYRIRVRRADYNNVNYTANYRDRNNRYSEVNFHDHVDLNYTATHIIYENNPSFNLPMVYQGRYQDSEPSFGRYCTTWNGSAPHYYNLERENYKNKNDLTNKFINSVKNMSAGGGTDMYQGLLAAPSQFYHAKNKNRYIIVLSDGAENSDTFDQLVDNGLCNNIREKLKHPYPGADYNLKMFVVGVGFNPKNYAYNKCFGEENIIPVSDMDKLKETILSLIADDIGHNFDRNN